MNLDFELIDYAMQFMPGVGEALDAAGIDGQRVESPGVEPDGPFQR